MKKKCFRFYGGLIVSQERWLNRMAGKGFRLVRTTKTMYEFESCPPGQYQYCVEFIGQKSRENAQDYARFLEDCGYRVFFKNINLNWNVGKVEFRPWADKGGRLAHNGSTYNRELLIVEKENDGRPFELHTTYEDRLNYCKTMRRPWLFLFVMCAAAGIFARQAAWGVLAGLSAAVLVGFQVELARLKKQSGTREW